MNPLKQIKKITISAIAATLMFSCSEEKEATKKIIPQDTVKITHQDWMITNDTLPLISNMEEENLELLKVQVEYDMNVLRWEYGDTNSLKEIKKEILPKGISYSPQLLNENKRFKQLSNLSQIINERINRIKINRLENSIQTVDSTKYNELRKMKKPLIMDKLESLLQDFKSMQQIKFYYGGEIDNDTIDVFYKGNMILSDQDEVVENYDRYEQIMLSIEDREHLYKEVVNSSVEDIKEQIRKENRAIPIPDELSFNYKDFQRMKQIAEENNDRQTIIMYEWFERNAPIKFDSTVSMTITPYENRKGGINCTVHAFRPGNKGRKYMNNIKNNEYDLLKKYYDQLPEKSEAFGDNSSKIRE